MSRTAADPSFRVSALVASRRGYVIVFALYGASMIVFLAGWICLGNNQVECVLYEMQQRLRRRLDLFHRVSGVRKQGVFWRVSK